MDMLCIYYYQYYTQCFKLILPSLIKGQIFKSWFAPLWYQINSCRCDACMAILCPRVNAGEKLCKTKGHSLKNWPSVQKTINQHNKCNFNLFAHTHTHIYITARLQGKGQQKTISMSKSVLENLRALTCNFSWHSFHFPWHPLSPLPYSILQSLTGLLGCTCSSNATSCLSI